MTFILPTLFGSCRERNLKVLDPNVPDENYMFLVSGSVPDLGTDYWKSSNTNIRMNALNGFRGFSATWMPNRMIWSGGLSSSMFGYGFDHPNLTSTNELYLRAQIGIPVAPLSSGVWSAITDNPIVTIIDNITKDPKLKLSWVWNGDTMSATKDQTRTIKLEYKDKNDVTRVLSTVFTFPVSAETGKPIMNLDIKVFIPFNGVAKLSVGPIPLENSLPPVVVSGSAGVGYSDTQPNQFFSINSYDGITPTHCMTRYSRIGVGNKISTALP